MLTQFEKETQNMERIEVDGEVFLFPKDNPITVGGTVTVDKPDNSKDSTEQPKAGVIIIDDEPGPSTGRVFALLKV